MGGGKNLVVSLIQSKKVVMISKACSVASLKNAVGRMSNVSLCYDPDPEPMNRTTELLYGLSPTSESGSNPQQYLLAVL